MPEQTRGYQGEDSSMKFNEEILKEFALDAESVKEPVNVMRVRTYYSF